MQETKRKTEGERERKRRGERWMDSISNRETYVHTVAVLEEQRMKEALDRARRQEEERYKKREKIIDCDRGRKKKKKFE